MLKSVLALTVLLAFLPVLAQQPQAENPLAAPCPTNAMGYFGQKTREDRRTLIRSWYSSCPERFCELLNPIGMDWVVDPKNPQDPEPSPLRDPFAVEVAKKCPKSTVGRLIPMKEAEVRAARSATEGAREAEAARQAAANRDCPAAPVRESALAKRIRIGMSRECAIAAWGKPNSINRTGTAGGIREQWVYGGGNYLYFDNGVLTAWQD